MTSISYANNGEAKKKTNQDILIEHRDYEPIVCTYQKDNITSSIRGIRSQRSDNKIWSRI